MTRSEAARLNGPKSRGPVTAEGKRRSSANAFKHGLTGARDKAFVCQNESQEAWGSLYADFCERFNPVGPVETDLVADLAHIPWRLRRCSTVETGILDAEMDRQSEALSERYERIDEPTRTAFAFSSLADNTRILDLLPRYETGARRGFERTLRTLLRVQKARLPHENKNCETNRSQPSPDAPC